MAVAALIPAMLLPNLAVAAPFMFVAAGGLGGAFPPADAARLDVMHSRLWGRARRAVHHCVPCAGGFTATVRVTVGDAGRRA